MLFHMYPPLPQKLYKNDCNYQQVWFVDIHAGSFSNENDKDKTVESCERIMPMMWTVCSDDAVLLCTGERAKSSHSTSR
jgi:hypothetical protein